MQRKYPQSSLYVLLFLIVTMVAVQSAFAREMQNHTAKFTKTQPDMGMADPSQVITVTIHLKGQNDDQIASFIQQLHDPSSPNFQKWITPDQFDARFGATAGNIATVKDFINGKNLKIVGSDAHSITVTGKVGDIQNVFHTQIRQFNINGKAIRANISNPIVDEPAGALVKAVSGLTEAFASPHSLLARNASGKTLAPIPLAAVAPNATTAQCLGTTLDSVSITALGSTAAYTGQDYLGCFFQPAELQTAYNFNALYSQGLDGTGETIVIIDAFGSPTLAQDVALFDRIFGLPAAKINIFTPNGPPVLSSPAAPGFATETTLDVEWAHVVAPNATINLVIAQTNSFVNLTAALTFAVQQNLGPSISNSFGSPEDALDDSIFTPTELALSKAVAAGISVNYSTGDDGDFDLFQQRVFGTPPGVTSVSYPSGSTLATAVGGTSLFVNADNTFNFETGWGGNLAQLNSGATFPFPDNNTDENLGFIGGAGGGASQIFPKPNFQRGQPGGNFRQQPDIAYLADPLTGVEIVQTVGGVPSGLIIGGTSLACPMFSALWTIGAQAAGGHNIGQAAQIIYDLKDGAINDVRQVSSPGNVTGVLTTPNGTINLTDADIIQPGATRRFISSFAGGGGQIFDVSFGTDTSLVVGNGWDNVTGLGTPNAPVFIQRLVKQLRNNGNSGGGN